MFLDYSIQSKAEGNRICFITKLESALAAREGPAHSSTEMSGAGLLRGRPLACAQVGMLHTELEREAKADQESRHPGAHVRDPSLRLAGTRARVLTRPRRGILCPSALPLFHSWQMHVVHDVPLRVVQELSDMLPYSEPSLSQTEAAVSVIVPAAEIRGMKNVLEATEPRCLIVPSVEAAWLGSP